MDTLEVLALARRKFPKHRFGRDHEGETIGVYNENLGRFQVCLYRGTDGLWYAAGKEILFGGQPVPRTWCETEQPATVTISKLIELRNECRAAAPEALILIRVGDFFEAVQEDAEVLASITSVALTRRGGHYVAGFPHRFRDAYVARLVAAGRRVAIMEMVPDSEPIDRRTPITRVIA